MNQSLTVNLQSDQAASTAPSLWVRLEQAALPAVDEFANFTDIYEMLLHANSGLTAWAYQRDQCPIEWGEDGEITVFLDFYSFPSDMAMSYGLSASIGTLSEPVRTELQKEFDLIVTGSSAELPFSASAVNAAWQSPAFDSDWRIVPAPAVSVDGSTLTLAREIAFGVLRVTATAHCFSHQVAITLDKNISEENPDGSIDKGSYRIENLQCAITAAWTDEDGEFQTEQLQLRIPPCVEAALAECEGGGLKGGTGKKGGDNHQIVYYSTCTGNVIMVDSEEDD